MKKTVSFTLSFMILGGLLLASMLTDAQESKAEPRSKLEIELSSIKTSFILGEPVQIDVRLVNEGEEDLLMDLPLSMESGSLQVLVASEKFEYGRYLGPGWGADEINIQFHLKPKESLSDHALLLWNKAPKTEHLSDDWGMRAKEGLVPTEYVFNHPGTYRIKVMFQSQAIKSTSNEIQVIIRAHFLGIQAEQRQ